MLSPARGLLRVCITLTNVTVGRGGLFGRFFSGLVAGHDPACARVGTVVFFYHPFPTPKLI